MQARVYSLLVLKLLHKLERLHLNRYQVASRHYNCENCNAEEIRKLQMLCRQVNTQAISKSVLESKKKRTTAQLRSI